MSRGEENLTEMDKQVHLIVTKPGKTEVNIISPIDQSYRHCFLN